MRFNGFLNCVMRILRFRNSRVKRLLQHWALAFWGLGDPEFWWSWNIVVLRPRGVAEIMEEDKKGIKAQELWGPCTDTVGKSP